MKKNLLAYILGISEEVKSVSRFYCQIIIYDTFVLYELWRPLAADKTHLRQASQLELFILIVLYLS